MDYITKTPQCKAFFSESPDFREKRWFFTKKKGTSYDIPLNCGDMAKALASQTAARCRPVFFGVL